MKLFIVDAIGPFFNGYKNQLINWSKIPFNELETNGGLKKEKFINIKKDFKKFIITVTQLGYNAITLDDIAHLVPFDFYPALLNKKIKQYQRQYQQMFNLAKQHHLKIFLNTDVVFSNQYLIKYYQQNIYNPAKIIKTASEYIFKHFPIDGVIIRFGESDGLDVKGDFVSRLTVTTPQQLNKYIKTWLPTFEQYQKLLIIRTWTIGAYKIGDLMWNKKTYDKCFKDICSPYLIVSLKYGETDFFRNLELSKLFFNTPQQKIIELQAKREYDGLGELPFFVGWDYYQFYHHLKKSTQLTGLLTWCQTGGWSHYQQITFLHNSSIWAELNTVAIIKIFHNHASPSKIIRQFFPHQPKIITFLKQYQDITNRLLYFYHGGQKLYFRRLRLPPLLWIHWNQVIINPFTKALIKLTNAKSPAVTLKEIDNLCQLGQNLNVPKINYIHDTLTILYNCRQALLDQYDQNELIKDIKNYTRQYPHHYQFSINISHKNPAFIKLLLKIFVRRRAAYRPVDYLLMNPVFSYLLLKLIYLTNKKHLPKFVNRQAMSFSTLFK